MNRKHIPLVLMLVAGAVTCIITLIRDYTILGQLATLLIVLVIFYFLGSVLKWTLDRFERQNMENESEEEITLAEEDASTDGEYRFKSE